MIQDDSVTQIIGDDLKCPSVLITESFRSRHIISISILLMLCYCLDNCLCFFSVFSEVEQEFPEYIKDSPALEVSFDKELYDYEEKPYEYEEH